MRTTKEGFDLIKRSEGCKLTAYYDSIGIPTIGYGHTGVAVHIGQVITQQEADNTLYTDIMEFETEIAKMLTHTVNDNQFSALVSFAYNLGPNTLKHSTLLKFVNEGNFEWAAEEFMKWTKAAGEVLLGLLRRRKEEKALFLKPVPPEL